MATIPADAFAFSGTSFLSLAARRACQDALTTAPSPAIYAYRFGGTLDATEVDRAPRGALTVWGDPVATAAYVIAAVPGYSATAECPWTVVSVWEASRDRLVQVAEFADLDLGVQRSAWVMLHLLASYPVPRRAFILEIGDLGGAVLQELKRVQEFGWGTSHHQRLRTLVGPIRAYHWRRPDTVAAGGALQWKTTPELRVWLLQRLRDQLDAGRVDLRSPALFDELQRVYQRGGAFVVDGAADHRVVAAALAVESWASQLQPMFLRVQGRGQATTVLGRMTETFFARLNAVPLSTGRPNV